MMNDKQKLGFIYDCAYDLIEKAKTNEETVEKLASKAQDSQREIRDSINELNNTTANINLTITKKINENTKHISDELTRDVLRRFKEANQYAEEAAKKYKNAVKWAAYKVFLFAIILFALVSLAIWMYYKQYLPKEIEELYNKKEYLLLDIKKLQDNLEELEKLNGNINISYCIDDVTKIHRKCVEVDPLSARYGNNGQDFRVLKGY